MQCGLRQPEDGCLGTIEKRFAALLRLTRYADLITEVCADHKSLLRAFGSGPLGHGHWTDLQ